MLNEDYNFDADLRRIEQQITDETSTHQMSKTMVEFLEKAVSTAESVNKCLVCNQSCGDDAKDHIRGLQSKVKDKQVLITE